LRDGNTIQRSKWSDIKLLIKLAPKWFFYSFIYIGYFLEAVWQRFRDKDYIGRYVHPVTKAERFLFPFGNLAGGLKNSARLSICIPDKPVTLNPVETTLHLLDHEVLHQVLAEIISEKASEGLDEIQGSTYELIIYQGKISIHYKMFLKWKPHNRNL